MSKILGKGLLALMGSTDEFDEEDGILVSRKGSQAIREVAVEDIMPGNFQPRKFFAEDGLQELAESIKANGILAPILVREVGRSGKYQIIAGERRWRAGKLAGLKFLPVIIKDLEDQAAVEVALIENIQRKDLTPIEEAEGYQRLMGEYKYTQLKLAERLGKSRSHVANMLRVLTLPGEVKEMVNSGILSMGHAKVLVNVVNNTELAKDIVAKGLNVRDTEKMIKKVGKYLVTNNTEAGVINRMLNSNEVRSDASLIEEFLTELLFMKVKIIQTNEGGVMSISFHNLEQLDMLTRKLSGE